MKIVIVKDRKDLIIDVNKHSLFFKEDNEINKERVEFYRDKLRRNESIEGISNTGIKVVTAIYSENEKKHILKGVKPNIGDTIYVVTNGHHRITAMLDEGITKFEVKMIGYKL